jgi:hypothetical protein
MKIFKHPTYTRYIPTFVLKSHIAGTDCPSLSPGSPPTRVKPHQLQLNQLDCSETVFIQAPQTKTELVSFLLMLSTILTKLIFLKSHPTQKLATMIKGITMNSLKF